MISFKSFTQLVILLFISVLISNCGQKPETKKEKPPQEIAFDEYQKKRLAEFETYFADGSMVPGLESWQMVALLMDWNLGENRYSTLSIFRGAKTNIFKSTGTKDIEIEHQNVYNEITRFLQNAERLSPYAQPMNHTKLPEEDHFNFYFKTNAGSSKAEGFIGDVQNNSSKWADLFR